MGVRTARSDLSLLLVLTGFLALPSRAQATPVSYEFVATIYQAVQAGADPNKRLSDYGVSIGTPLTAVFTLDPDATPDSPGFYTNPATSQLCTLMTGGLSVASPSVTFVSAATSTNTLSLHFEFENIFMNGTKPEPEVVVLNMLSGLPDALPPGTSPLHAFDPSRFQAGDVYVEGPPYGSWMFRANVTRLSAVPTPPTWLLVSLGLVAFGVFRRVFPS